MQDQTLITKYRPEGFEEMYGNELVVKALADAISLPTCPHSFLFSGPSGTGKTTLALILGKKFDSAINEIDVATNNSVESTRNLAEMVKFKPITEHKSLMVILNECHNYNNKGFEPLLDVLERPPNYLYTALTTTRLDKVPAAIKNRCYHVALKPVKPFDLEELIATVAEFEKWPLQPGILQALVRAANGSPRMALSMLQAGHAAQDVTQLAQIVADVESEDDPCIKLCQYLMKNGKNWRTVIGFLEKIEDPDEAIMDMTSYLSSSMVKCEEEHARDIWRLIRAISESQGTWDKRVQLFSGIGKILWGTEPF